ncbi:Hypothetical predicted protein [Mytilus galloprovincialis]|uniref:TLC domain-containing protein n=1 Tax=Mytilus galloprovincialis TaxID=29158 RepID=A0A8B6GWU0_MYTGA|nr:Hypothetical predicted protein [Mytilus galloprovincialis]
MFLNKTTVITSDLEYGYPVFCTTIIAFSAFNKIVSLISIPALVGTDPCTWRNLIVSGIHGLIAGIWGCLCLLLYPELIEDPYTASNPFIFHMVVFCSGYFVYDFIDHFINGKSLQQWEVTLHHIACIAIFWHNWHTRTFIGYSCIALLTEGNSFFLHSRKLLRICKFGYESILYRVCVVLNFVTFILFRVLPIMIVFHGCYFTYYRHPNLFVVSMTTLCTVIVAVVNSVLLWRLCKTDIIIPYYRRVKTRDIKQRLENNNSKKID